MGLKEWIRDHDEKWLFVVLYLGLAVGLSMLISLFWLVAVAALHFGLELVRQSSSRQSGSDVFLHALWEIKLDVGLVLLSFALVLYIDQVLGLLGLQSAARATAVSRAGARIATRAAAWERNIRTFVLTIDEMFRVGNAATMVYKQKINGGDQEKETDVPPETAAAPRHDPRPAWRQRWGPGAWVSVGLIVLTFVLILAAPWLTHHDLAGAVAALLGELRPLP